MKWVYKSSENIGSFLQQRSFWDLKMQLMFNVQSQRKQGGSGGPILRGSADVLPVLFFPGKISLISVWFWPFWTIFLAILDNFWPFWTIFGHLGHFWQIVAFFFYWFLSIFDNLWPFCTIFGHFLTTFGCFLWLIFGQIYFWPP